MRHRRISLRSLARVLLPLILAVSVIAPSLMQSDGASAAAALHYLYGSGSATGGKTVHFRVELTEPAPAGGAVVTLSSSNGAIPMPATVTVNAGETTREFGVASVPVTTDTNVTVSAIYKGVTKSRVVLIKEPYLSSLSVQTRMRAGGQGKIIARLSGRAPAGGIVVNVTSSNPAVIANPGAQTVVAGAASVIIIVNPTFQVQDVPIDITAVYDGISITKPTIVRYYPTDDDKATMTAVAEVTQTAIAGETSTAIANETATADANASATEAANQTATADANASATEAANQTATADANASATEAANQTATAQSNEATQTAIANDITQTAIAADNSATAAANETAAAATMTAIANEATGTAVANETETAIANETATEAANQTATADAYASATQAANQTATAAANETATEAANQTATADANASATEAANQTATADANASATEAANQTATADANASATAAADQTATQAANDATATQAANDATATQVAIDATATQAAIDATSTAIAGDITATAVSDEATATAIADLTATAEATPYWTIEWLTAGPIPNGGTASIEICANNLTSAVEVDFTRSGGGFVWPSFDDYEHNFPVGDSCKVVVVTNNSGILSGDIIFQVRESAFFFGTGAIIITSPPIHLD